MKQQQKEKPENTKFYNFDMEWRETGDRKHRIQRMMDQPVVCTGQA